jgi:hypothetical protein
LIFNTLPADSIFRNKRFLADQVNKKFQIHSGKVHFRGYALLCFYIFYLRNKFQRTGTGDARDETDFFVSIFCNAGNSGNISARQYYYF